MNYLKTKLEEKKMSQQELADRLGVSKQYISALCLDKINIKHISVDRLIGIAHILDIPIEEYLKGITQ